MKQSLTRELVALVRQQIGPVASFRDGADRGAGCRRRGRGRSCAASIRTHCGRLEPAAAPPTIDDPVVLDEIAAALK